MDHTPGKERDVVIDIDGCLNSSKEVLNLDILDDQVGKMVPFTVCRMPMVVDELANGEIEVSLPSSVKHAGEVFSDSGKHAKKENRKPTSAKKPPKPPRPPRGLSLDTADLKLIKEISELAMIKRARIERMKALKKMKAGKTSSSISTSSNGNLIALMFTVVFCILIVFQGCHSSGIPLKNNSAIHIHGSSESSGPTYGNIIVVQQQHNSSTSNAPLTSSGSPYSIESVPGSDIKIESSKLLGR